MARKYARARAIGFADTLCASGYLAPSAPKMAALGLDTPSGTRYLHCKYAGAYHGGGFFASIQVDMVRRRE